MSSITFAGVPINGKPKSTIVGSILSASRVILGPDAIVSSISSPFVSITLICVANVRPFADKCAPIPIT